MLKTLQRDALKLVGIVLVSGGLFILAEQFLRVLVVVFALGVMNWLLTIVLPACINEQKKLWNIGLKYVGLRLACEVLLFILTVNGLPYSWLKWPFFVLGGTLFLGFLCAAAQGTGLWNGIKILLSKHLLKWLCVLVFIKLALWLGTFLSDRAFVQGMWGALTNIFIVYSCLPWFRNK